MKYCNYIVIFISLLIFDIMGVNALSCSNSVSKDLGQIASYVKASYEVIDKSETKKIKINDDTTSFTIPKFEFEISIYNITDDVYLTISDDIFDNTITVTTDDTNDGVYTFINSDFGKIYNYTIKIYSANSDCYGETIRTINLVKPKYNAYSEYTFCQNSTLFYCQKFTAKELGIKDADDFLEKIKVNNENNDPDRDQKEALEEITNLFKKNWKIYLLIFLGIIAVTVSIIVIIKKRNKNKGWRL